MADDYIISYSDLIGDDGTFEQLTADLKKLKKELLDLAKISRKAFDNLKPDDTQGIEKAEKQVKEYEQQLKNVIKTEKVLQQTKKKTIDLTQEELVQREAIKLENRERVQRAKQLAIIAKAEKDSIEALRAKLSLATLEWKKFTSEEIKNTKEGQKVFNQKKNLTEQLKKLEKATGDHRRSVGDYAREMLKTDKILKRVRKTMLRLFVGRTIVDGILRLGGAFKGIVDDFRGSNEIIAGVGKSFDKVTGALQYAGVQVLEFLAPAIEVVANGLAKLPAFFAGIGAATGDFVKTSINAFSRLSLQISILAEQFNKINPLDDRTTAEIEANIERIKQKQTELSNETVGVRKAFREAYNAVLKEQEEFVNKQAAIDKKAADKKAAADAKKLKAEKDRIAAAEQQKLEARLKAIESIQKQVEQLEAENIKDAEERAIKLEQLRFENEIALRTAQFNELEKFFEGNAKKLEELKDLENEKAAAQLEAHEQNMLDIRKDYLIQTQDIAAIDVRKDALKEQEALLNEEVALVEDANQRKEESNKELFENISATANKVGDLIVQTFEKQADLSKESVNEQVGNLERARDRAAQGLETNLAFEEKELAKRQAEQQRKQKEAEQASRILALFNLVSAYAAGGDENALARGLVDWSLMTAFASGFEEGGYTGDEGQKAIAGVVHGQEFVVTARDTAKYNLKGKSGEEFGEAMSDYYTTQSPVTQNHFPEQREAFKQGIQVRAGGNEDVVNAIKKLEIQMASQPNYSAQIVKSQEDTIALMISEQKKGMRKVYQKVMRAKK